MPEITAIRGLRYDLGHVGSLADVVAPPYDVIDQAQQAALYERHPHNVVRLILNREEPGDDETENKYVRAGRLLRTWRREGVLQTEPDPALYVYHQTFTEGGVEYTRRGLFAGVRLERFGEGAIFPHEETHPGPKADRLRLLRACGVKLSPIFGVYPDADNTVQELLAEQIAGRTPLEVRGEDGVTHRLWTVTDVKTIAEVAAALSGKPTFVADGHHRYETACTYRDEVLGGREDPNHPANFTLMAMVSMDDPGMIVLPTHRLFRGIPAMTAEDLTVRLGDCFTCRAAGEGAEQAPAVWEEIELTGEQGTLALFTDADQRWTIASITDVGRQRMQQLAPDRSPQWRELGVSVLHRLIVETLLGMTDLPKPLYSRDLGEVVERLAAGDTAGRDATGQEGAGGRFLLAAMVMPASLEHVRAISQQGERMPAKSTFFYPKLLSGLVMLPLS